MEFNPREKKTVWSETDLIKSVAYKQVQKIEKSVKFSALFSKPTKGEFTTKVSLGLKVW